jgi:hypothetical protein
MTPEIDISCPYCGRRGSLPSGSALPQMARCRYCESKSPQQPLILNNNVSTSSSAAAAVEAIAGNGRNSLMRSFLRFCVVIVIAFFVSLVAGGTGHTSLAATLIVACSLTLVIGISIYVIRFLLRMLFG